MTTLSGKHILVVEDEYFIASDVKRALKQAGAEVLGPVGSLEEGVALAEGPIDAAILDVNLEGTFSYPIADRLAEGDVPYLFVTGYDSWALPDAYREIPRVAKPFSVPALIEAVGKLVVAKDSP